MGRKVKDITGQKFNRLTAIKYVGKEISGAALWLFRCDCGKEVVVRGSHAKSGITKSCGCLRQKTCSELALSMYKNNDFKEQKKKECSSMGKKNGERTRKRQLTGKLNSNNTSGVTGVYYYKTVRKWRAMLTYRGKTYRCWCKSFRAAVRARKQMEQELGIYTNDGITA